MMETAKIIENDGGQTVRLPETCRLSVDEVLVRKLGDALLLVPKEKAWETFMNGLRSFPDDFLADGRGPDVPAAGGSR